MPTSTTTTANNAERLRIVKINPRGCGEEVNRIKVCRKSDLVREKKDAKNPEKWREQSPYWAFTRDNGGRSVGMTSAHYYSTWADPNFFQTFANSIFWVLEMEIPEEGVDIATPTEQELDLMMKQVEKRKKTKGDK